jgi:hypothetical protein
LDDLARLFGVARACSVATSRAAGPVAAEAPVNMATTIRGIEGMKRIPPNG